MSEQVLEEQVKKAIDEFGEPPRIILTGKTGAGKSSLVNALLGKHVQQTDVVPCTMEEAPIDWNAGLADIKLVDVPGFAEANMHADRVSFILNHIPECHAGLLVVPAPDRALEHERQFLEDVRSVDAGFPMIAIGNKIDLMNPVREWNPSALNLKSPATQKEANIVGWANYVKQTCAVPEDRFCLIASGEKFDDHGQQYGLQALRNQIFEALPDAAKNYAARVLNVEEIKKKRATAIVFSAAAAAAAAAVIPIPVADAVVITGIQVGMVVSIAMIFGLRLDARQAIGLLGPALAFFAGPLAFQQLIKILPGVGSVLGAGIAGVITLAIGMTYLHFFILGKFKPSAEEVKEVLKKKYEEAKNYKDQLEREAARKKR